MRPAYVLSYAYGQLQFPKKGVKKGKSKLPVEQVMKGGRRDGELPRRLVKWYWGGFSEEFKKGGNQLWGESG